MTTVLPYIPASDASTNIGPPLVDRVLRVFSLENKVCEWRTADQKDTAYATSNVFAYTVFKRSEWQGYFHAD